MRRIALVVLLCASPALADDAIPATHKGQLGLSARLELGVRGIATYNSDYCGVTDTTAKSGNAPVCTGRAPLALDLEPSYGVARAIELTLAIHLGLEREFGPTASTEGPRAFRIEPGARFYFSEAGHSKLFVQPSVVFDFTNYQKQTGASYGTDIGVRALEGYMLDLHRSFSVYAFVGETAEVSRWLYADLELGIGIQGRYP
jgi:hypothetical protein